MLFTVFQSQPFPIGSILTNESFFFFLDGIILWLDRMIMKNNTNAKKNNDFGHEKIKTGSGDNLIMVQGSRRIELFTHRLSYYEAPMIA